MFKNLVFSITVGSSCESPFDDFIGLYIRFWNILSMLVSLSSITAFCQLSSSKWIVNDYQIKLIWSYTKLDVHSEPRWWNSLLFLLCSNIEIFSDNLLDLDECLLCPLFDHGEGIKWPEVYMLIRVVGKYVSFVLEHVVISTPRQPFLN
jgi:hypothetical protein